MGVPKRKAYFEKIIKTQDVFSIPSIERLIFKHAEKEGVDDSDNIQMMKEMIFNGLSYDFFGGDLSEPTEEYSEKDFDIIKNDGEISYRIRGFIDKLFLYKDQKFALIISGHLLRVLEKGGAIVLHGPEHRQDQKGCRRWFHVRNRRVPG